MELPIEWLPSGRPEQLIVLLHGVGSDGIAMAPLAQALRNEFPQAALLAPDAPEPHDGGGLGRRQWFSLAAIDEANRPARVAAALARFVPWLRAAQDRLLVPPVATAIGGFSQGAILALEAAAQHDGLAGRVLAFSGRFARIPKQAPQGTTLHLFHGGADPVFPASHAREALQALGVLRGDATLDIAEGVGHELHPALVQRALFRLRNHIPARTWAAALGAVPELRRRSAEEDDED